MKRLSIVLLSMCLVLSLLPLQALASTAIKVTVDGRELVMDQNPVIINGRTLVPLRAIFEALNAYVDYNQATKIVTAKKGNTTVTLQLGSKSATINGVAVQLDVEAQIIKGRTLVPVRFVSEALGEDVQYDSANKLVTVSTKVEAVTNVYINDVADHGDGRDLLVGFTKVADESKVDHYRIMLVKTEKAYHFTVDTANQVSSSNYTVVGKEGRNIQRTLSSSTRDTDGDLIKPDQLYTAYVLTVSTNAKASHHSLSQPSASLKLNNAGVPTATNVRATDVADYGNGRDLQVSFNKAQDENHVSQYRILVVRESQAKNFTLSDANAVNSSNYTTVNKTGSNISTTLSSSARDVSGNSITNGIAYRVFVMTIADSSSKYGNSLSEASAVITLSHKQNVPAVTNLRVTDVSDYGDGRDVEVSFTKVNNENQLHHYRVYVVRSGDVSSFDLAKALEVSSSNYTRISKTGSNIKEILGSSAKDTGGRNIQAGVNYRVFVLSFGDASNGYGNTLSSASSEFKLTSNPTQITVSSLSVADVADHGDGRDLQVSFNIPSNEYRVTHYRIMVVRANDASNFRLDDANKVSSSNYTVVTKTGKNIKTTLSSNTRDVNGNLITTNVAYRVFVLSVGDQANAYLNSLSSASSSVTLNNNFEVKPATNVRLADISDHGDGRDIQVTFNRSSDENKVSEYRIMIVKSAQADGFTVSSANSVSSSNYTSVSKTGSNITRTLSSSTRDIQGEVIRPGVAYKAYVLAVSSGGNNSNNALSTASPALTLTKNITTPPATNVRATDVADFGDGRDLQVSFTRSTDETKVQEYRIMVVKANQADSFSLSSANAVATNRYTSVAKTGSNPTRTLTSTTRDVHGDLITSGVAYRVFVLAVSTAGSEDSNALSAASATITLSNPSVDAVTNVTVADVDNNGDGRDLQVSFNKAATESNISYYAIMVVRSSDASSFNLAAANAVSASNYTIVGKTGSNITTTLSATARDTRGNTIQSGVSYRVFVLSIADGSNATINALSSGSNEISLGNKQLTWSGLFNESAANDGSINTVVTVSLAGDQFVNGLTEGTHYTVANVPAGLSVNVLRLSAIQLQISLTGNAIAHTAAHSISNLTISFTGNAFTSGNAAGIASVGNNVEVRFTEV
ncbi:copper amine oxidase N-terminal domain-containing protein [Caldalkalibacillus mannanilyticus]|uniref:copper amine oxidase N-terminal domain-containing protein n=1 Tax=Caldalkalibacillus mannanilyticus TaxID=1418 RepID=UPI0004691350|nr:copper amine oxidase N-terminal domain-containing protein [Caldalkalibacillus mannanilyticus]